MPRRRGKAQEDHPTTVSYNICNNIGVWCLTGEDKHRIITKKRLCRRYIEEAVAFWINGITVLCKWPMSLQGGQAAL